MFLYFFEDYKEKIYKGSRRKLTWLDIIMLGIMFLSVLTFMLSVVLAWGTIPKIVLFCIMLLSAAAVWIYTDKLFKKNRDKLLEEYKEGHIESLINLLRSYDIYTISGLDWLIYCCNEKRLSNEYTDLSRTIKSFFNAIVYPLITLGLGLVLKECSTEDVFLFVEMMIVLFIMGAILIVCLKPLISFMLFPERNIVNYLEDDLKYVKVQYSKEG